MEENQKYAGDLLMVALLSRMGRQAQATAQLGLRQNAPPFYFL